MGDNNSEVLQHEIKIESNDNGKPMEVTELTPTYINPNKICKHRGNCFLSALKIMLRNFGIGYGLRASIALLSGIFMRKLYKQPRKLINQSILHKDIIGFGLFLGCYTGGYRMLNCLLRNLRGKDDGLNSMIAGFFSGSAMMFSKSTEMALYLFARALESIFNAAHKRGYVKSYKHGDTLLFCLCTTIMFYAFVWEPKTIRPSYLKFLSKVAGSQKNLGQITAVIRESYYLQNGIKPPHDH
ncbi:hypothetical protein DLAC_08230 [Tieghemostelium lacteum]|uniref:Transmembrane protein n=1 Tax=Tieghemostelium lacteum TaxID=361077 RepID=A0A151ZBI1_TIELA|nr:hypothetical protein DLAC_08230 [Tieghemostelium lacteum]|eukprot:KYQ91291.1 hypothetical protein DLAC_08230 [Tieghemostelium lacteum]